jgi:phage protein D
MAAIEFKVLFDNVSATREQLDKIEEITVEQQVDMAWEARLLIPVVVDNDGKWKGEDEAWMRAFARVRVEVKIGRSDFVPLIDGPVTGFGGERSAQPGESNIVVLVSDDSAYLNQEDEIARFEDKSDSDIARQLFSEVRQLSSAAPDIEETPPPPAGLTPVVIQRGRKIHLLRELARRNGMHVYVLPGETRGESKAAFRKFPVEPDGLPPMILLGANRNIAGFNPHHNAMRPLEVRAASLSITDKSITTGRSSYLDARLMGDAPATDAGSPARTRLLPPRQNDSVDLGSRTGGLAEESSYSTTAAGNVIPHRYAGVLLPYRVVLIKASESKLSAKYLITKVTHTLTRSTYTQAFEVLGNAVSEMKGAGQTSPAASANLGVSFNTQASIF